MTNRLPPFLGALLLAAVLVTAGGPASAQSSVRLDPGMAPPAPAAATLDHPPPASQNSAGNDIADLWRGVRQGVEGTTTNINPRARTLIQSEGELWRAVRNGPLSTYGLWALGGIVALLALFFAVRGRIRIDGAPTGRTVERFNLIERAAHWLTAGSFVVLGLTGLNVLYGRHALLPLLGPEAFAALTHYGKLAHNFLGFSFIAGLTLIFLMWVRHNIPDRHDLTWIAKAGGLFSKGVHPPAKKFNAGQKVIFWSTILGGAALSFTGIQLLFPFYFATLHEIQLFQIAHAAAAVVMVVIILAHIYIGSIGMEGAFDAMGSGQVEEQWAREHHSLWLAEVTGEDPAHHHHGPGRGPHPAE